MDDMNAFERQIASVVRQATRPPRPPDVSLIMQAATSTSVSSRIGARFSLTKSLAAGTVLALAIGSIIISLDWPDRDDELRSAGASGAPMDMPIQWRTRNIELLAKGVTLTVGDDSYSYTADGAEVVDCGWCRDWMSVHWPSDIGTPPLTLVFGSDDTQWYIRLVLVGSQQLQLEVPQPLARAPIGEPYVGDLLLQGEGYLPDCDVRRPVLRPATLSFDEMRLSYVPREESPIDMVNQFLDDPSLMLFGGLSFRGEPGVLNLDHCPPELEGFEPVD